MFEDLMMRGTATCSEKAQRSTWLVFRCLFCRYSALFAVVEMSANFASHITCNLHRTRNKGKDKGHTRTGHEGAEVRQTYRSTLSLTAELNTWYTPRLVIFTPGEK